MQKLARVYRQSCARWLGFDSRMHTVRAQESLDYMYRSVFLNVTADQVSKNSIKTFLLNSFSPSLISSLPPSLPHWQPASSLVHFFFFLPHWSLTTPHQPPPPHHPSPILTSHPSTHPSTTPFLIQSESFSYGRAACRKKTLRPHKRRDLDEIEWNSIIHSSPGSFMDRGARKSWEEFDPNPT
jgi:hypothetical protein